MGCQRRSVAPDFDSFLLAEARFMTKFSNISLIDPEHTETWAGKVFLSLDIDWAHDEVLYDSIQLIQKAGVASTWFVTHETPLIASLRNLKSAELGIHPNFNPLLDGTHQYPHNTSEKILKSSMSLVEDAKAIRSHSLTQNERLIDQFKQVGLTHISNTFIPYGAGIVVKPFKIWDQMVVVPHCWQDNVALRMPLLFPKTIETIQTLYALNFHPIHVFLNTESIDRYERTRAIHNNPKELLKHRYTGVGTRTKLTDLLRMLS
jgi:hypothetical protein